MNVESMKGFRVLSDEEVECVAGGASEVGVTGLVDWGHLAPVTPDYHFIVSNGYTFVDRNSNRSYDGVWRHNPDGSYSYSDDGSNWSASSGPAAEIDAYYLDHYQQWEQAHS